MDLRDILNTNENPRKRSRDHEDSQSSPAPASKRSRSPTIVPPSIAASRSTPVRNLSMSAATVVQSPTTAWSSPPRRNQSVSAATAMSPNLPTPITLPRRGTSISTLTKSPTEESPIALLRRNTSISANAHPPAEEMAVAPTKRRRRQDPVPIWAQRTPFPGKRRNQGAPAVAAPPQPPPPAAAVPRANGAPPPDRWEPSIMNEIPMPDFDLALIRQFFASADFGHLFHLVADGQAAIEVEAKMGQLVDRSARERLRLPVLSETLIDRQQANAVFQSSIHQTQFKSLNQFLNRTLQASLAPHSGRIPLRYEHTVHIDTFYRLPAGAFESIFAKYGPALPDHGRSRPPDPKLRVTRDKKTGKTLEQTVKLRVMDLDIYSPNTTLDWRLSVNLEIQYPGEADKLEEWLDDSSNGAGVTGGKVGGSRTKDRMSYMHQDSRVDLTRVVAPDGTPVYELEVEMVGPVGEPQMAGFLNNVHLLVQQCPPPEGR